MMYICLVSVSQWNAQKSATTIQSKPEEILQLRHAYLKLSSFCKFGFATFSAIEILVICRRSFRFGNIFTKNIHQTLCLLNSPVLFKSLSHTNKLTARSHAHSNIHTNIGLLSVLKREVARVKARSRQCSKHLRSICGSWDQ